MRRLFIYIFIFWLVGCQELAEMQCDIFLRLRAGVLQEVSS